MVYSLVAVFTSLLIPLTSRICSIIDRDSRWRGGGCKEEPREEVDKIMWDSRAPLPSNADEGMYQECIIIHVLSKRILKPSGRGKINQTAKVGNSASIANHYSPFSMLDRLHPTENSVLFWILWILVFFVCLWDIYLLCLLCNRSVFITRENPLPPS